LEYGRLHTAAFLEEDKLRRSLELEKIEQGPEPILSRLVKPIEKKKLKYSPKLEKDKKTYVHQELTHISLS
jgi:hypothetical protein